MTGMPIWAGWNPLQVNLHPRRWTPYRFTVELRAFDFSGATFAMQVRPYRDAQTVLLTLGNAAPGSQGISCSFVDDGLSPAASFIVIEIAEATIETLPFPTPRGSDLHLAWDMHITSADVPKRRWFEGEFRVIGGATHV